MKAYSTSNELLMHMRVALKLFACEYCDKIMRSREHWNIHVGDIHEQFSFGLYRNVFMDEDIDLPELSNGNIHMENKRLIEYYNNRLKLNALRKMKMRVELLKQWISK